MAENLQAVNEILSGVRQDDPDQVDPPTEPAPVDEPPEAQPPVEAVDPLADVETKDLGIDAPSATDGPPQTLADAAEKLGMKIEDLYALDVPMRDGVEPIKLGALKDFARQSADVAELTVELETQRSDFENSMIRAKQELQEVVNLLPNVPDVLIEQARATITENQQREHSRLMEIKPDWKEPEVYQQARSDILEAVADYGFTRSDLDLVIDHRLTKLLHDFSMLKRRVASATAKHNELKTQQNRGGRKATPKPKEPVQRSSNRQGTRGRQNDQLAQVNAILSEATQ